VAANPLEEIVVADEALEEGRVVVNRDTAYLWDVLDVLLGAR